MKTKRIIITFIFGIFIFSITAAPAPPVGEFRVNTYTTDDQEYPDIAVLPNDNFVVVWQTDVGGGDYDINAQIFDSSGNKIGSEFRVNQATANPQEYPAIAVFSDGNFVVVWQGQDSDTTGVYARIFSSNGTPITGDILVNTTETGSQENPDVAVLPDNNFVIVWQATDLAPNWDINAQIFDSSGNKIGSEFKVNAGTGGNESPAVAAFPNGNFVVVWQWWDTLLFPSICQKVFARIFDPSGNSLTNDILVESTFCTIFKPATSTFSNNNFVVAWNDSSSDIYFKLLDENGNAITNSILAVTYSVNEDQERPAAVVFPNDNFIITWDTWNVVSGDDDINAQIFAPDGNKLGSEFRAHDAVSNYQWASSVAAFSDNNFVITWIFSNGDRDIFAKLFEHPSCADFGGIVCSPPQICSGTLAAASDTNYCCIGTCQQPPPEEEQPPPAPSQTCAEINGKICDPVTEFCSAGGFVNAADSAYCCLGECLLKADYPDLTIKNFTINKSVLTTDDVLKATVIVQNISSQDMPSIYTEENKVEGCSLGNGFKVWIILDDKYKSFRQVTPLKAAEEASFSATWATFWMKPGLHTIKALVDYYPECVRESDETNNETTLQFAVYAPEEICWNGIDDDNDDAIDEGCYEICNNGIDDDLDGQIDEDCYADIVIVPV